MLTGKQKKLMQHFVLFYLPSLSPLFFLVNNNCSVFDIIDHIYIIQFFLLYIGNK